jgi:signal transduction histidine kinase
MMNEREGEEGPTEIDVLSSITHELRTPINSMKGFIEFALKDETLRDETREKLEKALNSSKRLQTMVNDLLDLSILIGTKKFNVYPRWFFLNDLITSINEDSIHLFKDDEVVLRIEVSDEMRKLKLRSDPSRLRQVILNLLDNAVKYTMRGYVDLICIEDENDLLLMVKDTGIGIEREQLKKIFEPFYQVSSGTNRSSKGSGIGLTISKEIIERLGGKLTVESTPGEGATFIVKLPIVSEDLDMVDNLMIDLR